MSLAAATEDWLRGRLPYPIDDDDDDDDDYDGDDDSRGIEPSQLYTIYCRVLCACAIYVQYIYPANHGPVHYVCIYLSDPPGQRHSYLHVGTVDIM